MPAYRSSAEVRDASRRATLNTQIPLALKRVDRSGDVATAGFAHRVHIPVTAVLVRFAQRRDVDLVNRDVVASRIGSGLRAAANFFFDVLLGFDLHVPLPCMVARPRANVLNGSRLSAGRPDVRAAVM